jgi:succinate dehydrogenase / fumarate reductase, flavoprotein subunit
MSESLRNDGRVWAPKTPELAQKLRKGEIKVSDLKEEDRDYFLERKYPSFGNLVPRDVASRNAKEAVDEGKGVGGSGVAVFLDFAESIARLGEDAVRAKYGNLFDMYYQITDENPYKVPMRIYPAVHYTMGGLWVDYNLQTTLPGLYCLGEANFSDHGANRLGASALMQGLADGYFVIPYTLGDYFATIGPKAIDTKHPAFAQTKKEVEDRIQQLISLRGTKTVDEYHRELGHIMWEYCGMARTEEGLTKAKGLIAALKVDFWKNAIVLGANEEFNSSLEKAGRVADFIELGALMVEDALMRKESCGGHFRVESQTEEGEALRDDDNFAFVSAWEYKGEDVPEVLNKEPLVYENVKLTQRSYK